MPSIDETLIKTLEQLDAAGDLAGCLRLLMERKLSADELFELAILLYRIGLGPLPLEIVLQLRRAGAENWVLQALAADLAVRLGRRALATRSIGRLVPLLADDAAERRAARELLAPSISQEVSRAFHAGDKERLRDLARLWSVIEPETMRQLAPPPLGYRGDPARLLREGPVTAPLLRLASPPADTPRPRRKAVLAIRRYWFPHLPTSREHETPVCLAAAMEAYGWTVIRYHLRSFIDGTVIAEDYRAIAQLCRESAADLLVLDDFLLEREGTGVPGEVMRSLKADRSQLRLVGLYLDCWQRQAWDGMEAAGAVLDACWTLMGTAVWKRAALKDKILLTPLPNGGSCSAAAPLRPELSFHGGVHLVNWYRAFWLTGMADAGLPLRMVVSSHQGDNLDPLDSYRQYMRRVGEAGAMLNFARRHDAQLSVTGRTFEVPAAGGLLVQERSDDIDLFLVPGRHYLRFESLTDLADIARLLREAPELAEEIRLAGADFVRERYADEKIIGYLEQFVFHRHSAATAAPVSTS